MTEKDIRAETAERLGISVDIVDRLVDWLWKKNKEAAKSPALTIEVPNLGYFKINKRKMIKDLKRYKEYAKSEKGKYLEEKIKKMLVKRIEHPEWSYDMAEGISKEGEGNT